jgi:hypothetical protein
VLRVVSSFMFALFLPALFFLFWKCYFFVRHLRIPILACRVGRFVSANRPTPILPRTFSGACYV